MTDTSVAVDTANQTLPVVNEENDQGEQAMPNVQITREVFEKKIRKFGTDYGKGMNSRPAMAMYAVQAAQQVAGIDDKCAKDLYAIFQKGAADAKGLEYKREASFGVQVSKFKNFLTLGAMPNVDGVAVMEVTTDLINELSKSDESPLKGSAYDNMVKVARQQIKRPEEALSEEEIRGLLTPDAAEKSDLDKLIDSYKRVRKLTETVDVEPLLEAQTKLGEAITALGGELPAEPAAKANARQVAALIRRAKADQAKLAALTGQNVNILDVYDMVAKGGINA